jgi:hypothetical protein
MVIRVLIEELKMPALTAASEMVCRIQGFDIAGSVTTTPYPALAKNSSPYSLLIREVMCSHSIRK